MLSNLKNWINGYENDAKLEKYLDLVNEVEKTLKKRGYDDEVFTNIYNQRDLADAEIEKHLAEQKFSNFEYNKLMKKIRLMGKLSEEHKDYVRAYGFAKNIAKNTRGYNLCN